MVCKNKKCVAGLVDGAIYCHICGKRQEQPARRTKRANGKGCCRKHFIG